MLEHLTRSWPRRVVAAAVAVAAITLIPACSSSHPVGSTVSLAGSSVAPAAGQHLSARDFSAALKGPGTIVLDVRTPAEYASGHLPAAQNIDIGASDFTSRVAALDKLATYAVYCHSGSRSGTALQVMAAADVIHAYDLAGGIGAWQTMGGPLVTGKP